MRPLPAGAVKRTASGIASEVKSEGPGPDVTGLDTLNRSLAMELRPLGLPPWCVDQATPIATPGQTVSPRGACQTRIRRSPFARVGAALELSTA